MQQAKMCTTEMLHVQEMNPLLSAEACDELFRLCQLWQVNCVLLDATSYCLRQLHLATSDSRKGEAASRLLTDVSAELSNRREWDVQVC
jgi:hypothetical protein